MQALDNQCDTSVAVHSPGFFFTIAPSNHHAQVLIHLKEESFEFVHIAQTSNFEPQCDRDSDVRHRARSQTSQPGPHLQPARGAIESALIKKLLDNIGDTAQLRLDLTL
jgi:hypothetical protein